MEIMNPITFELSLYDASQFKVSSFHHIDGNVVTPLWIVIQEPFPDIGIKKGNLFQSIKLDNDGMRIHGVFLQDDFSKREETTLVHYEAFSCDETVINSYEQEDENHDDVQIIENEQVLYSSRKS